MTVSPLILAFISMTFKIATLLFIAFGGIHFFKLVFKRIL